MTVVFAGLPELDATDGTPDAERLGVAREPARRGRRGRRCTPRRDGGPTRRRHGDGRVRRPEAHEDDALRAIRAARELRDALRAVGSRLVSASAPARCWSTTRAVVGTGVAIARALEQAAAPGEILLALATLRILRGTVVAEALELQETVPQGFRLLELAQGADPRPPRDTPLVARRSELVQLRKAFQGVQTERRCRVVTVVGEAGIGKTRLALEVCGGVREHADVLVGRCVSYGEGASYLPLRELVEQSGEELDAVLAGAGSVGEEHLKLRTYFARLANERPLVLVLEDIHWAEPTLLDLIESFGALAGEAPILVLCLARPDLLDVRPTWPVTLTLAPLERDELVELLAGGNGDVEPGLTRRIAELAEGNPLYAEQLLAYAREGGSLDSVPPTIEALLMSRIDRLPLKSGRSWRRRRWSGASSIAARWRRWHPSRRRWSTAMSRRSSARDLCAGRQGSSTSSSTC